MRRLTQLILVAALLGPATVRAGAPTHVACVGDSITYGYAASSPSASYPSDLQGLFGSSVKVMDFGHSSATMLSTGDVPYVNQPEYTAATSFVSGAGPGASVAVVLMLGTNDSKPQNWMSGSSATQFQTDAAAMVDHFAKLATRPIVYVVIPPRAYSNSYGIDGTILHDQIDQLLLGVLAAKGLPRIDLDAATAGRPELFSDGVHPTDAGYALVAQIIHDGLVTATGGGLGGAGGGSGSAGTSGGAGAGGSSAGGHSGATGATTGSGGSTGSGGTVAGGSGGGSGTGGSKSTGTGSGGSGTGGSGTGGSTTATSTGGNGNGSGGQSAAASGGAAPSSSGGSGGAMTRPATGGSSEASDSSSGCACSLGAPPLAGNLPVADIALSLFGLLMARKRRARERR